MKKLIEKTPLFLAAGFGIMAIAAAVASLIQAFTGTKGAADFAAAGTLCAILAGALLAAWKFSLFREGEPHLTISQQTEDELLAQSYRIVTVTAFLHNTSKVVVQPTQAWCEIFQLGPMDDQAAEKIYQQSLQRQTSPNKNRYDWWLLNRESKGWIPGELKIEPNEKCPLQFEFMIGRTVTLIKIRTAIANPRFADHAWPCYTLHKLSPAEKEQNQ